MKKVSLSCILAIVLLASCSTDSPITETVNESNVKVTIIQLSPGWYMTRIEDFDNRTVCYIEGHTIKCLRMDNE